MKGKTTEMGACCFCSLRLDDDQVAVDNSSVNMPVTDPLLASNPSRLFPLESRVVSIYSQDYYPPQTYR